MDQEFKVCCIAGYVDIIPVFLEFGCRIYFNTFFHAISAKRRCLEVLKLLLDSGVNFNSISSSGISILQKALMYNNDDAAILLLDYGANSFGAVKGETPLQLAREHGCVKTEARLMGKAEVLRID